MRWQPWAERPLEPRALGSAALGVLLLLGVSLAGAGVRLLPWLLDPEVSSRVLLPFARSIGALAVEAAILVGWPVGWSLAVVGLVERSEHRLLQSLGERPARTAMRLAPQAVLFAGVLAIASYASARDATAPGRVITELLQEARGACESATAPRTYVVPFVNVSWLCAPGTAPLVVGRGPGAMSALLFSARDARIAGDLRRLDLDEAHLALGAAQIFVRRAVVRGLEAWGAAPRVSPWLHAVLVALAGAGTGLVSVYLLLRRFVRGRFAAIATSAAGPLALLACFRAIERSGGASAWTLAALPASLLATFATAGLFSRLPWKVAAASK